MGNEQSNTRTRNYKKFRITEISEGDKFFRFYLDDYVTYSNGNHKNIDFERTWKDKFLASQLGDFQVGNYVEIDLEETRHKVNCYNFDHNLSLMRKTLGGIIRDSNGEIIQFLMDTNEYLGGTNEMRQNQLAAVEYGRWASQTQAWTSYNLPPK